MKAAFNPAKTFAVYFAAVAVGVAIAQVIDQGTLDFGNIQLGSLFRSAALGGVICTIIEWRKQRSESK